MAVSVEQLTQAVTNLSNDIQDLTQTVETEAEEIVQALKAASGGDQASLQAAIDEQTSRLENLSTSAQAVRQRVAHYIP